MKNTINLMLSAVVATFIAGCGGGNPSNAGSTSVVNNIGYIPFSTSVTSRNDVLYKTDGTAANTNIVSNTYLPSGSNNLISSSIGGFVKNNNTLYIATQVLRSPCLVGCNLTYGYLTLNLSNDTVAQPSITKVVSSNDLNSFLPSYVASNNGLYVFSSHSAGLAYADMKLIDNTGVHAMTNNTDYTPWMIPLVSAMNNNSIYVSAHKISNQNGDITDFGILKLDTSTNTFSLLVSGYYINSMAIFNSDLYFIAKDNSNKWKLFKFDTNNNVTSLYDFNTASRERLYAFNGSLYFIGGTTIYKYDIANGTINSLLNTNIAIGTNNNSSKYGFGGYIELNNKLYLYAGNKLFEIDGANNSATNLTPNLNITDNVVYKANGKLYFGADNGSIGTELYKYDGSSVNLVKDINIGAGSSIPRHITELNGDIVFQASQDGTNNKLFKLNNNTLTPLN